MTLAAPHREQLQARRRAGVLRATARGTRSLGQVGWRLVVRARLLLLIGAGYMAVAILLVEHADLIVLDSLSRTAHAAFVWHDHPAKLATLGFVWPPVTTLTLLPVTLSMRLARSGLAAPITSALVMAATITVAISCLSRYGVRGWTRAACALLLAANPVLVFYGANGMTEAWALLFPALALAALLRWETTRGITPLAIASLAGTGAMMSRYELAVIPVLVTATVFTITWIEERDLPKARALALFCVIAPVYAMAMWMLFNWMVQGAPLWFLTSGGQVGTVTGTASTLGGGALLASLGRVGAIGWVVGVQLALSPLLFVTTAALVVHAVRHRRPFAIAVAIFAASNLLTNAALVGGTGNAWFVNLRFNMRGLDVAVIAAAWLARELASAGRPQLRRVWLGSTVALLAIGIPTTAWAMHSYPVQFGERAFLQALGGARLDGRTVDGQPYGCGGARQMGSWIAGHVRGPNAVIADDSSSSSVILFSSHPQRFLDRADRGDAYFGDQLAQPTRTERYLLVSDFSNCSGVSTDLIHTRFGGTPTASTPGLSAVHSTPGFALYRIDPSRLPAPHA